MRELHNTSVPLPFQCYYAARVEDDVTLERTLHAAFDDHRIQKNREFFKLDPYKAKVIIELLALEEVTPRSDSFEDSETAEAVQKLVAARMAADVCGVPTLVIARTDAEAADLLTSDYDANDKPFITGERTAEGFFKTKKGMDQAVSRAIAYAHYADLVWCETGTPDLEFARKFAEAVHKVHPGKMLAYNCSPSFNWKKNLDDATIAKFQRELGAMGYKYQFITLAGIHSMWFNMFDLAQDYAARGMSAYVEKVQEPEFAARTRGYSFVSHQQEVGTGYFDDVTTVIQGGQSSVTALTGSTEEEQFH